MITEPRRQHAHRGLSPTRPEPRATNTPEHQARLSWRLTDRDKWILRLIHEHRVLTAEQIVSCAFPSQRSGRARLRELYLWSALDRFQPLLDAGSAPMHYVLGPAGASVVAAEAGLEPRELRYRRDRAIAIAHHHALAHTVGVNEWFTTLLARTRTHPSETVHAWWAELRCQRHFGDLVRPDAYARIAAGNRELEFFLEYDLATESSEQVAAKLPGYARLAAASRISTPLLLWVPTRRRENTVRTALTHAQTLLEHPDLVPIATAAADQLDPAHPHPSPAEAVWAPLPASSHDPARRCGLYDLADLWPDLPPPSPGTPTSPTTADTHVGLLPPPAPMPPGSLAAQRHAHALP